MTRKPRRGDDRQRLFLTTALTNPAIREIEAEHTDPAPFSDVLQAAAFGLVCGGFAALLAHGLALALLRPGYAMQLVAFGAVALVGALIRAGQIADSRRSRQWATFDAAPEVAPAETQEFVPIRDDGRTLVLERRYAAKRKNGRPCSILSATRWPTANGKGVGGCSHAVSTSSYGRRWWPWDTSETTRSPMQAGRLWRDGQWVSLRRMRYTG